MAGGAERPWTADEVSIVRLCVEQGLSDAEIGERLGRTGKSVGAKRAREKISTHRPRIDARPLPLDFIDNNAIHNEMALRRLYSCGPATLRRWRAEAGVKPKPRDYSAEQPKKHKPRKIVSGNYVGPKQIIPPIDGSIAARAARFLMRDYRPVCRLTTINPSADKNLWVVGRVTMTSGDMIDKAEDLGFQARMVA